MEVGNRAGSNQVEDDSFMVIEAVMKKVSKRKTWIYACMAQGTFPKNYKIGKSSLWSLNEINRWIQDVKEGNI